MRFGSWTASAAPRPGDAGVKAARTRLRVVVGLPRVLRTHVGVVHHHAHFAPIHAPSAGATATGFVTLLPRDRWSQRITRRGTWPSGEEEPPIHQDLLSCEVGGLNQPDLAYHLCDLFWHRKSSGGDLR